MGRARAAGEQRQRDAGQEEHRGENGGGPRQQVGRRSSGHEAGHAAAAHAERAPLALLQQNDADERGGDHQMDDEDDGDHGAPFSEFHAEMPVPACQGKALPLTLPSLTRWAPPSPTRGEGKLAELPLPLWERVGVRGQAYAAASAMAQKSAALRLAPPTRAPSTSPTWSSSRALSGLTDPP